MYTTSAVSESRGNKAKSSGPEDDFDNVPPISQSVAMAIAGNPFNTLARNALVSMASVVRRTFFFLGLNDSQNFNSSTVSM